MRAETTGGAPGNRAILLLGGVGAGKTTALSEACAGLAARGVPLLAFLSPALDRGVGHRALGYDLVALGTSREDGPIELDRSPLARRERPDLPFRFFPDVFSTALARVDAALRPGAGRPLVLGIDEIGLLELDRGGGWAPLVDRPPALPLLILSVRDSAAETLAARLSHGPSGPIGVDRFRVGDGPDADGRGTDLLEAAWRVLVSSGTLVDRRTPEE